jgi:hypothetical protein
MQPTAIWIIYTLMFGYPVPTLGEYEFTSEAACVIQMRSFSQQVIDAFQLKRIPIIRKHSLHA